MAERFEDVVGGGVSSTTEVKSAVKEDSHMSWLDGGASSLGGSEP